jgi:UPF0271 protein
MFWSIILGKAHGALYHDLSDDKALADARADAVLAYGGGLSVLALARSPAVAVLRGAGVAVVGEAFADRGHTPVRRLGPRSEPGAVITDVADVTEGGRRIAIGAAIADADGSLISVQADTLCVRSDTPESVQLAAALRRTRAEVPVDVRAFA